VHSEPDVIGDDGGRNRGLTTLAVVLVLALLTALAVKALGDKGSSNATPAPSTPPTSSPSPSHLPSPSQSPSQSPFAAPQVVLRVGDEIDVAVDNLLVGRDILPAGATDVSATTLSTEPLGPDTAGTLHVFGLDDGRAFRQDIGGTSSALTDLGAASAVLRTQEYPVLVHDGDPVVVGSTPLPAGWQPGRFENLGYAGLLIKPVDAAGNVEIASWVPGGPPEKITSAAQLLGLSDGAQAIWLDPSCPDGPRCRLYFSDLGGIHPQGGMAAPAGTHFADSPAALGDGGFHAAVAIDGHGVPLLVVVSPWQGDAQAIEGSAGVETSSGMFWRDGTHLIFAVKDASSGGTRLAEYNALSGVVTRFGPVLPDGAQLLTAVGATGGVTVLP
jgi:hypothetical protein